MYDWVVCSCAFKLDILIHLSSEVLTGFLFSLHLWDLIYKFIITPIIKKDFQYTSKNLTCTLCTTKGIHQYPIPQYTPKVSMSSLLSPSFMEGKSQRGYSDNVLMKWSEEHGDSFKFCRGHKFYCFFIIITIIRRMLSITLSLLNSAWPSPLWPFE